MIENKLNNSKKLLYNTFFLTNIKYIFINKSSNIELVSNLFKSLKKIHERIKKKKSLIFYFHYNNKTVVYNKIFK